MSSFLANLALLQLGWCHCLLPLSGKPGTWALWYPGFLSACFLLPRSPSPSSPSDITFSAAGCQLSEGRDLCMRSSQVSPQSLERPHTAGDRLMFAEQMNGHIVDNTLLLHLPHLIRDKII